MIVHFPGTVVRHFDDVPDGIAFRFAREGSLCTAIKAFLENPGGRLSSAVVIEPELGQDGPPYDLGKTKVGEDPVLTMPDLRLVPSILSADMRLSQGINYEPGKVYIFPDGLRALAFTRAVSGDICWLLDLCTGNIIKPPSPNDAIPIEVQRWALAIEIWGKPWTLFTYPSGSPTKDFR